LLLNELAGMQHRQTCFKTIFSVECIAKILSAQGAAGYAIQAGQHFQGNRIQQVDEDHQVKQPYGEKNVEARDVELPHVHHVSGVASGADTPKKNAFQHEISCTAKPANEDVHKKCYSKKNSGNDERFQ
jgi:hypothetical protein